LPGFLSSRPPTCHDYFVIRNDGRFLIKCRDAATAPDIVGWTEHPSIVRHAGGDDSVRNVLAIEAGDSALVVINGVTVHTLPRSEVWTDGIVGLRVNHYLNLHVSELTVR
jgi:hypothetical protein